MGELEGKEDTLQGPLLAHRGPKLQVRPPPPTGPRPGPGRTRSRSAAFARGEGAKGGSPKAPHKVWSREALSWRDLGLGGGRWGGGDSERTWPQMPLRLLSSRFPPCDSLEGCWGEPRGPGQLTANGSHSFTPQIVFECPRKVR